MLVIDKYSKKGQSHISRFLNRPLDKNFLPTLSDCYNRYSFEKLRAYNDCWSIVAKYVKDSDSYIERIVQDWGILSYNTFHFTFGAKIWCHNKVSDIQYYEYIVITKNYAYLIK